MSWQKLIALHMNILNKVEEGLIFFKNGDVSVYSKKDEKKSKKHLTKREVFGNIDEHC